MLSGCEFAAGDMPFPVGGWALPAWGCVAADVGGWMFADTGGWVFAEAGGMALHGTGHGAVQTGMSRCCVSPYGVARCMSTNFGVASPNKIGDGGITTFITCRLSSSRLELWTSCPPAITRV